MSVIHSVHRGEGVCLTACWDTTTPPPRSDRHPLDHADTPWDQTPPGTRQVPPQTRQTHPLDQADTPQDQTGTPQTRQTPLDLVGTPPGPGRHSPWTRQTHPTHPGPGRHPPRPGRPPLQTRHAPHPPGSRLQHTVYERPVRILLECILVIIVYGQNSLTKFRKK